MHLDFCKMPEQVQLSQSKSDNWSFRTEKRTPSRKKQNSPLKFLESHDWIHRLSWQNPESSQFPDFSQVTVRSRSISGFSLRGSQPSVLHRNFVLYCFLDTVGSVWRAWCSLKNFSTNQQLKRWLHSWFILLQAFPRTGRGDGRGDSLSSILSVNLCSIR